MLYSKDGNDNPNPEYRLANYEGDDDNTKVTTPYDNKIKYANRSPVYFLTEHVDGISDDLIGKSVMFVTNNVFLKKNELADLYKEQKLNPNVNYGVRLVVLSNKGVSFKSLYR
jgi:deoxyadenosine/deoxycytidine kinase